MRLSRKILIGLIVFILLLTTIYTVIFWFKGDYPVVIFTTLIPACITELIFLYKLEINERNGNNRNNNGNNSNNSNRDISISSESDTIQK